MTARSPGLVGLRAQLD